MAAKFDEMNGCDGGIRPIYRKIARWLAETPPELLASRRAQAELLFRRIGITFAVYGDKDAAERLIPFDIVPRIIGRSEWAQLEAGLAQRVKALNLFLADIYGRQEIIKAGVLPADLVYRNPYFLPEMVGRRVPHDIYVHIAGIDVIRVDDKDFYVLEDNLRTPSGVSYMLENREVMMRLAPDLYAEHRVAPVENYPDALLAALRSVAPASAGGEPVIALLTPGQYNSAYYEHSFLADKLGVELVEGRDLLVRDDIVYMRTTEGPKRVDVIYRRIDDAFLDPLVFRPESVLGAPGLVSAYLAGNVTLANAIGTGIGDDKAVNGSGGYGMLIGPHAARGEIDLFRQKLKSNPDNFIAQPTLSLSTCPTSFDAGIASRHVDLRPFVLSCTDGIRIVPGGLTRVALQEGSLVVNSSQGGGTKDTWIVDDALFDQAPGAMRSTQWQGPSGQDQQLFPNG
jgi:uncharacterized circularly permuted ATP-grasp superfamily protein